MNQINIANIVSVSVSQASAGAAEYSTSNIAIFTAETPVTPLSDVYDVYTDPTTVATIWGSASETFLQATAIFAQAPNILVGGGKLVVIPLLTTSATAGTFNTPDISLNTSNFDSVANGALKVKIDAASTYTTITGLSFGVAPTLAHIASIISAGITASGVTAAVSGGTIVFTSATTGAASKVKIQAASSGTDITALGYLDVLLGTTVDGQASGAAETVKNAIIRTKDIIYYQGILATKSLTSEVNGSALATYVQGIDKLLFFPSSDVTQLNSSSDFDNVRSAGNTNTRCLYYSVSDQTARIFAAAYASRGMAVNFNASNTTTTQHLKTLTGITGDTSITQTILGKALAVGADCYPLIANLSKIYSSGTNSFFDDIFNLLWFKLSLQVNVFNVLATTATKIPQTEDGMDAIKSAIRLLCDQAVSNRFVGPGTWTAADTFGDQANFLRNIIEKGYYLYSSPVSSQSVADREDRKSPVIQVAIKYQGASHSSDIIISVNK